MKLWSYCRNPEHWRSDSGEFNIIWAIPVAVNSTDKCLKTLYLLAVRKVSPHINILIRLFWRFLEGHRNPRDRFDVLIFRYQKWLRF